MNFAETEFDGLIIEDYRLREISIGTHALDFLLRNLMSHPYIDSGIFSIISNETRLRVLIKLNDF